MGYGEINQFYTRITLALGFVVIQKHKRFSKYVKIYFYLLCLPASWEDVIFPIVVCLCVCLSICLCIRPHKSFLLNYSEILWDFFMTLGTNIKHHQTTCRKGIVSPSTFFPELCCVVSFVWKSCPLNISETL